MMSMQSPYESKRKISTPKKIAIIVFWLAVWEIADRLIHNRLVLAGPIRVVQALFDQLGNIDFWVICGASFGRLACGFLLSFVASVILAVLAHRFETLRDFVDPVVSMLKTVPMISFVIMMLIWVGNQMLTVYLALLVVLPFIYTATLAGLENADERMLEMAGAYELSRWKRFMYIYRPALMPFLLSSCKVALGMSWKTGIMAEVIGTPRPSIGREMYIAKSYLDTPDLFAWTVVVIVLSLVFEKVFMSVLEQAARPMGGMLTGGKATGATDSVDTSDAEQGTGAVAVKTFVDEGECKPVKLAAAGMGKSFGESEVLRNVNASFDAGGVYCLMGPSGMGKTTLMRILSGLDTVTSGEVDSADVRESGTSFMFQEDRLCECLTPSQNVALACSGKPDEADLRALLAQVLPADCLDKAASQLSGGMRRRVALVRAVAHRGGVLVLDEPFTGLDNETKRRVARFLVEQRAGRTMLVSTHNEDDAELLGAQIVRLQDIAEFDEETLRFLDEQAKLEKEREKDGKGMDIMIDATKTMREIVKDEPLFADFLVSKGFPFTVENPMTEFVTFNDVVERRKLNKEEFLAEYAEWKKQNASA
jgi:NitT/TauT family transport system permease protein